MALLVKIQSVCSVFCLIPVKITHDGPRRWQRLRMHVDRTDCRKEIVGVLVSVRKGPGIDAQQLYRNTMYRSTGRRTSGTVA